MSFEKSFDFFIYTYIINTIRTKLIITVNEYASLIVNGFITISGSPIPNTKSPNTSVVHVSSSFTKL